MVAGGSTERIRTELGLARKHVSCPLDIEEERMVWEIVGSPIKVWAVTETGIFARSIRAE